MNVHYIKEENVIVILKYNIKKILLNYKWILLILFQKNKVKIFQ